MNLEYRLIQFLGDPVSGEGRNIGVIAHGGGTAYFRGMGVAADGAVDDSYFRTLSDQAARDAWVYAEWAGWFQTFAANEGRDPEQFAAILDGLEQNGINIVARQGGWLEVPDNADPEQAMDWLFKQLVRLPTRPRHQSFDASVTSALNDSGITSRLDFCPDAEVEFFPGPGQPAERISFPYLLEIIPMTVFKVINFKTGRDHFLRQVNDALFSFERAVAHGFVEKNRCIFLTGKIPSGKQSYLNRLRQVARFVDVTDPTAGRQIAELVATGTRTG